MANRPGSGSEKKLFPPISPDEHGIPRARRRTGCIGAQDGSFGASAGRRTQDGEGRTEKRSFDTLSFRKASDNSICLHKLGVVSTFTSRMFRS